MLAQSKLLNLRPAQYEDKSSTHVERYPNVGENCGSTTYGAIRKASFSFCKASGFLLKERPECQVVFIQIGLGDHLIGRMHGDHRHAQVDGVNVHLGHEFGDGSAAAEIYLAQLTGLPDNAVFIENLPQESDVLRIRVAGIALAAHTGEFHHACAAGQIKRVVFLADGRIVGIKGRIHIRGNAELDTARTAAEDAPKEAAMASMRSVNRALWMLVVPSLPISSLSTRTTITVCSGEVSSNMAFWAA